ncbi:uncharacterized protein PAN0_005c2711 [Moesziomyces antarcticus]|uniref:Uncharacterized protein n=2 Tax=Pseudozyma antarctica TaxID=84753 RepID=A0A081CCV1_PSEA2|nr:uncharacterized protein PAN0_005c2711 [Moesziomyces antarcticus]GAK64497.1 conserved hypothetical protein [Moesziomyces antarcticus]SPO44994.1 uncharacterized protein PSANT_02680 [Moesziomyces antarcticus]
MTLQADPATALPPETFLYILSFLQPPALLRCSRVNQTWHGVCTDDALWRALSLRLGYCQLDRRQQEQQSGVAVVASVLQHLDQGPGADSERDLLRATVTRYRSRNSTAYFDKCDSWRALCCQLWRLGCNWLAQESTELQPPTIPASIKAMDHDAAASPTSLPSDSSPCLLPQRRILHDKPYGQSVWRCKLDPDEQTVIVTGQAGGIQVFDRSTLQLLWHIARTATRACPHLEFSRGWFVFDRPGIGHFEVWRSERLVPDLGRPPDRGHYQRFAVLSSTRPVRAYRFQFPYLCAASQDGFVMIWNVPDKELVQSIDFRDSPHRDGNVNYIDFDDDFVFLNGVGAKSVSVYSRRTGRQVWNMGQHFAAGRPPPAPWRVQRAPSPPIQNAGFVRCELNPAPPNLWQAGPNTMNLAQLTMTPYQIWSAVHPDLKTKTLLILGHGTVLLLRDYKKFFDDPSQPPELFAEIEFENLQEFFEREVTGGGENWSDLGWNSRHLWELLGDAQLTVHEGRAVIVNEGALILDLNVEAAALHAGGHNQDRLPTHLVREQHGHGGEGQEQAADASSSATPSDADVPGAGAASRQEAPPVLVYRAFNQPHSYHICSSVQMDEVGVYYTADLPRSDGESSTDIDLLIEPPWMGEKHVLVHLDFSRRQQIVPKEPLAPDSNLD